MREEAGGSNAVIPAHPMGDAVPQRTKKHNKVSHPTPTRWVVQRRSASILVLDLHSLRASFRGGWTRRCADYRMALREDMVRVSAT